MTVRQFFKAFPNDDVCLDHVMACRFGAEPECPECPKCSKAGKFHRIKGQPCYSCQWCGHHIHPCAGTPFENTRTSLQLWFYAIYLFSATRHGVSAKELERSLGVTYKTAWRMGHEIRKHMATVDGDKELFGHVEVDETYVGGTRPGKRGRGAAGKTVVLGMVERTGDVITQVVPDAKRKTLEPIIEENVIKGSEIHSDEWFAYNQLGRKGYGHSTVNHGAGEYVRGNIHTNTIEGFWSQLKRSILSTHIHVSPQHMDKYLGEFEFRFNMREKNGKKMTASMFNRLTHSF